MGKRITLREAIELIWQTVKISKEQGMDKQFPYLFVVGAGISAPEILPASGIVEHCQQKVKQLYEHDTAKVEQIFDEVRGVEKNSEKYYSFWFEKAYQNKIHRQQYLKNIIGTAKISTSNLLLAQILNGKEIASTVVTPNFDDHLLKSLNLLGNYNVFTANNVLDNIALSKKTETIQIMHVHGTYQFYDCCNLESEITKIANAKDLKSTSRIVGEFLKDFAPIVIGYSGWEDDVIMSEIKERLQYPLPYQWIWFCYTNRDYENLPNWLKEEENVLFVLPEEYEESTSEEPFDEKNLPAEDVLSALITKFDFKEPILFTNPLQYYIELSDQFLPENSEVFPIKSWKRRLDYIEHQLGDIDKNIIKLEQCVARKNIVDATKILQSIDFSFVVQSDLEHIYDAVILPLIANKNRIETKEDLYGFYDIILDILHKRKSDLNIKHLIKYLSEILGVISRLDDFDRSIQYLDFIIKLCEGDKRLEVLRLMALGMKSELADESEAISLQNIIIEQGKEHLGDERIARLVLIATVRNAILKGEISKERNSLIQEIYETYKHSVNMLENYYYQILKLIAEEIQIDVEIEEIIQEMNKNELSKDLLTYANFVKYRNEEDENIKIEAAREGVDVIEIDSIKQCRTCLNYSEMISYIIETKSKKESHIETKYINLALELCEKEGHCKLACRKVIWALIKYVSTIESEYEKKGISEKLVNICEKCETWQEWTWLCDIYMNSLEDNEKEEFLKKNETYEVYCVAREEAILGRNAYIEHDVEQSVTYLERAYEKFDTLFKGAYNPAAINIAFLVRRNEITDKKENAMEILDKIDWMDGDAIYHINKALIYVDMLDWENAIHEIQQIDSSIGDALEWWMEEGRVDKNEKCKVILLLLSNNILSVDRLTEQEIAMCRRYIESIYVPDCIKIQFERKFLADKLDGEVEN